MQMQVAETSSSGVVLHSDDDFSSSVSFFEISDGLRGLTQRVNPVDDWCYLVRLDQLFQDDQVVRVDFRYEEDHGLAHEPGRRKHLEQIRQRPNPATARSRSNRDESPLGGHDAPGLRQRTIPRTIENQVVSLGAPGEIVLGVIDDMVRANRSHEVHALRAAHTGHFRSERLGDLHCERANTARGTVDQDLLPRLNPAFIAKALQSGQPRHRYGRRLLEGEVGRLQGQSVLGSADIFGESAAGAAEYRIPGLEARNVPANRYDLSGQIGSRTGPLWFSEPGHWAHDEDATHEVTVNWIGSSGANPYQDFVVAGRRLFNVFTLQDVGRAVAAIDDGFHEASKRSDRTP